jgi:hypothetical protein
VVVKRSKGMLIKAQLLGAAEEICRRLVDGVRTAHGALEIAGASAAEVDGVL